MCACVGGWNVFNILMTLCRKHLPTVLDGGNDSANTPSHGRRSRLSNTPGKIISVCVIISYKSVL